MTRPWLQSFLIACLLTPGLIPGLAAPAAAQPAVLLDAQASRCAMLQALSPTPPSRCQVRTRSIVLRPPAGTDTVVAAAAPEASPARPSAAAGQAAPTPRPAGPAERVYAFTTRIPFAFDSAQLAPEARPLLDTLADARAVAVQEYLRDAHGLAPSRLRVVGRGKAELYDPDHPYDASNRRVEFVNLTDSAARP